MEKTSNGFFAKIKPYLGDKDFYKKVALIAVPIALQSMINIGVNMMDTIMLGTMGEVQISASSLANQFIMIYHICCMGIGMGANVLTSRYFGMGDHKSLKKVITIMLWICIAMGLLFMVVTMFFPEMIMRIYTNDAELIASGVRYFKWMSFAYIPLGLSLTCTIVLRSTNNVRLPLICSFFSFFVNIFFNWVFIFGNLGAPRMEIEGAALGTLIARLFDFVFICGYFFFMEKNIKYRFRDMLMNCRDIVKDYFRISVPVFISDLLLALGNNFVGMVIGRMGALFTSAYAITAVCMQLSTVLIQGTSNASAIITGQTIGEGNVKKAQRQGVTFAGLGFVIGLFASLLIMLMSPFVINFYNILDETKGIASELMLSLCVIVIFQSVGSILTKGVLRGGGDTTFLMLADVLFLWVASVPLGALAGLAWGLSPFWVYFFLRIDHVLKAIWCVHRLSSGKWVKKISNADSESRETAKKKQIADSYT